MVHIRIGAEELPAQESTCLKENRESISMSELTTVFQANVLALLEGLSTILLSAQTTEQ